MSAPEKNSRPRVGIALMRYFPAGGKQRTFLRILRELLGRSVEPIVYVETWDGPAPDGVAIHRLEVKGRSNHARQRSFSRELRARRGEVDLMVGFDLLEDLDLYYAGDPSFVARYRDERNPLLQLTPRYQGFKKLEEAVFGSSSFTEIILIAHGEKSRFQNVHGTEDERFHLMPPGIDRARLDEQAATLPSRAEFMTSLGLDPADGLLLALGSSFRTKGVDRVIEALAVLPASLGRYFALAVVGQGDSAPLELRARRLGIGARVAFTGPRDDVGHFYRHADLLVHPARVENTGTAILEAMCCGLPVLATANCGFAFHLLRARAGMVAPHPHDQSLFERMMIEALFSRERAAWSAAGRAYARSEDLYGLIEAAADLIEERALSTRS